MESSHRARCAASRAWVSSGLLDGWPHVSEQLSVPGVSFSGVGCGCQLGCWMHRFCNLDSHERPRGLFRMVLDVRASPAPPPSWPTSSLCSQMDCESPGVPTAPGTQPSSWQAKLQLVSLA